MKEELSTKEHRFVIEYVKDPVGGQAAIRAGYSKRSADQIASRLLRKDKVKAAIQAGQKKIEEKALVTIEYVVTNLREVASRCMTLTNFDPSGANRALELLGKHIGAFPEKHYVSGPNNGPIPIPAARIDFSSFTTEELQKAIRPDAA